MFSVTVVKIEPFGMVRDAPVMGLSFHFVAGGQGLALDVCDRPSNFPSANSVVEVIVDLVMNTLVFVQHTISNIVSLLSPGFWVHRL